MFNIPAVLSGPKGFTYPYSISQSAMFDPASTSYSLNLSSPTPTDATKATVSLWFKRGGFNGAINTLLSGYTSSNYWWNLNITAAHELFFQQYYSGANDGVWTSTAKLTDTSGWYHLVMLWDTSEAAADRAKFYINNVRLDGTWTDYLGQACYLFQSAYQSMGWSVRYNSYYYDGYLADVHLIEGTVYSTTDFAQEKNGIWCPKNVTGLTYGAAGCAFDFADNTDFGKDVSGVGNHMTDNGMGTDHQVLDSPTNNFAILNSNDRVYNITAMAEGGLSPRDANNSWHNSIASIIPKSGKWYWEIDMGNDAQFVGTGVLHHELLSGLVNSTDMNWTTQSYAWGFVARATSGVHTAYNGGNDSNETNIPTPAVEDILQVAWDADDNKIWFGVNNTWCNFFSTSPVPSTGTDPTYDSSDGLDAQNYDMAPFVAVYEHSLCKVNFGQIDFTYTPPTGFKALCTANLDSPSILEPDKGADVVLWTGDGAASKAITGLQFSPNLVWIKDRDTVVNHALFDTERGATKVCTVNVGTDSEATDTDSLLSFDSNGFTVGADLKVNGSGKNLAALCLKKAAKFGFDIVTWTGTGVAKTVSHSLGAVPELIVAWNRTQGRNPWVYHHHALGASDPETDKGYLNLQDAFDDDVTAWNDTAPTSSVFTIGTGASVNESGESFVGWLWRSIAGFSKVFYYYGNASAAGPFVYCGFRPRYIMFKNSNLATASWRWYDTARNTYNNAGDMEYILPDQNVASVDETVLDIYSNGFKIRTTSGFANGNTQYIVGLAMAEQPFNYANAR